MPSHLRRGALAGAAAALLIPAAASAQTFCVGAPACVGTPKQTLQDAINAAALVTGEANRIDLGSGGWLGAFKAGPQPQGLEIVGAGAANTWLQSTVGGQPALWLTGAGESVSGVRVKMGAQAGFSPIGLELQKGARAADVRVAADPGVAGTPVRIDGGGRLSHAVVDGGTYQAVAVTDFAGVSDASIADSDIRGASAISVFSPGTTTIARDKLTVTNTTADGVSVIQGTAVVRDTLIDLRNIAVATGLAASATTVQNASVDAQRVTVLASGGQSRGASVYSAAANGSASISLADSLLEGVGTRVLRASAGAAAVAVDRVDTWPAAADQLNGLVPSDTATFSADPLLSAEFVPQPGSPLIDRAAALTSDDFKTDAAGAPRALDGDGDCTAQPDIGAFEAPAAPCAKPQPADPAPVVTAPKDTSAPVITRLRFARRHGRAVGVKLTVSERAAITLRVSRCRTANCARIARTFVVRRPSVAGSATVKLARRLRHGRYTIRVTAVDAAGNRAVRTVRRAKA